MNQAHSFQRSYRFLILMEKQGLIKITHRTEQNYQS
jgi:hypothetical protein